MYAVLLRERQAELMATDPDAIVAAAARTAAARVQHQPLPTLAAELVQGEDTQPNLPIPASVVLAREQAAVAFGNPAAAFEMFLRRQTRRADIAVAMARMGAMTTSTTPSTLSPPRPANAMLDPALAAVLEANSDPSAYTRREAVFANNLKTIAALNEYAAQVSPTGYPTIAFGVTPFAHLTTQEFVDAYLKEGGRADEDGDRGRVSSSSSSTISSTNSNIRTSPSARLPQSRPNRRRGRTPSPPPPPPPPPRRRDLLVDVGGFPLTCAEASDATTEVPYPFTASSPFNAKKFD